MSPITTHVLDTATGHPAAGIAIALEIRAAAGWLLLGNGHTDFDGRLKTLLPDEFALEVGVYRLRFDTDTLSSFFPEITIQFQIADPTQHYHVPLLLSPYGYSTYRGS